MRLRMTKGQKKAEICVWRWTDSNQGTKRSGKGKMKVRECKKAPQKCRTEQGRQQQRTAKGENWAKKSERGKEE